MQSITPGTWLDAFASVPDPCRPQGRRFSLAAILALTVCGLLANQRSDTGGPRPGSLTWSRLGRVCPGLKTASSRAGSRPRHCPGATPGNPLTVMPHWHGA
jgi:hypothetical protein